MTKISAFIITYNEYNRITQAACSLIGNVDQLVIVDDGSDQVELPALYLHLQTICKWHGIEVIIHKEEHLGSHALHLKTALELCEHDWVFQLDSDEVLCCKPGELKVIGGDFVHPLDYHAIGCLLNSYVQEGTKYVFESCEPKIRFFNKTKGYYPKEHGVGWVMDDKEQIKNSTGFTIEHLRTAAEKRIDGLRYFKRYLSEYEDTNDLVRKKYYSDKFDRICEYYGFPFDNIDEAILKGCDECIKTIVSQWG